MLCKFDLVGVGEQINFLVSSLMYISKSLVNTASGSPHITILNGKASRQMRF